MSRALVVFALAGSLELLLLQQHHLGPTDGAVWFGVALGQLSATSGRLTSETT